MSRPSSLYPKLPNVVHVFTDFGVEDCDDSLAIKYLCSLNDLALNITIVFTGSGDITEGAAQSQWVRYFESNVHTGSNAATEYQYKTLSEYKIEEKQECDWALQISPMKGYTGDNLLVSSKYIFAGDFATPEGGRDSFNRDQSVEILTKFSEQGKLVDISSVHMAKMRQNKTLFSKFDGPFAPNIVFTAFLLAFGRMSPKCPVASKFAEGLVNPNVGRGVNYTSVENVAKNLNISCEISKESRECAHKYFKDIYGDEWIDENQSVECLAYINSVLNAIFMKSTEGWFSWAPSSFVPYSSLEEACQHENDGNMVYSDFTISSIPEFLVKPWEYFKKNADKLLDSFNPVYDLFAAYVLVGLIKGHDRKDDPVDTFLDNIVNEF